MKNNYEPGQIYEIKLKGNKGTYKVISSDKKSVYYEPLSGNLGSHIDGFYIGSDFDVNSKLMPCQI